MLPAIAPVVVVEANGGGLIADFAARVANYRRHHVVVVVRGECNSACTMVLALKRTCAEPDASFGFHRAFLQDPADPTNMSHPAPAGTRVLVQHYPTPIRRWITAHGGLTQRLIELRGAAMRSIVPACHWRSGAEGDGAR